MNNIYLLLKSIKNISNKQNHLSALKNIILNNIKRDISHFMSCYQPKKLEIVLVLPKQQDENQNRLIAKSSDKILVFVLKKRYINLYDACLQTRFNIPFKEGGHKSKFENIRILSNRLFLIAKKQQYDLYIQPYHYCFLNFEHLVSYFPFNFCCCCKSQKVNTSMQFYDLFVIRTNTFFAIEYY